VNYICIYIYIYNKVREIKVGYCDNDRKNTSTDRQRNAAILMLQRVEYEVSLGFKLLTTQ